MKTKIITLAAILAFIFHLLTLNSFAQQGVSINIAGTPPDNSAMLDVSSIAKGLLIPRMTQAQKMSIAAPANGLLIYQTDNIIGFWYYDATIPAWVRSMGPVGPTGPAGINGSTGPQGPAGIAGTTGATGPSGADGATGMQGPVGPTGLAGTNGATGPTGANGANGAAGPTGANGPTGPAGPSGAANAWLLTGNAGTTPGTNFLGTTDAVDMVFKTNNAERMRILSSGNIGIATSTPVAGLDIKNTVTASAGNAKAIYFEPTLINSASGDVLNALVINPTFGYGSGNIHSNALTLTHGNFTQYAPSAPDYPAFQLTTCCGHNGTSLNFDCYYTDDCGGACGWYSSYAGSNYRIYHIDDKLYFSYYTGQAPGTMISTWGTGGQSTYAAMTITNNGFIGIGNTSPGAKLEINGASGATLKIVDGNQGLNKVLTSDANGIASWAAPSAGPAGITGTGTMTANYITKWVTPGATGTVTNSVIYDNGTNVGIGTTNPTATLTVGNTNYNNPIGSSWNWFEFGYGQSKTNTTLYRCGNLLQSNDVVNPFILNTEAVGNAVSGNEAAILQTGHEALDNLGMLALQPYGGRVGIGTLTPGGLLELGLDQGRKPGTNTWTIVSDARLKKIEGPYTKGLKEILQLQPITYHYKNTSDRKFADEVLNTVNVGFSAQDVQKIFPEAVGTDGDGYLNFNMHSILVAYVNAIKEQQGMINSLMLENKNQQTAIGSLQITMENMQKQIDEMKAVAKK